MKITVTISADGTPVVSKDVELGVDVLVRYGSWYWYRTPDGVLHESLLSDENFGPVTDDELAAILRGERRERWTQSIEHTTDVWDHKL